MRTIKQVLLNMKQAVEEKQAISPSQWVDWGLELATLTQDLQNELDKAEINYKRRIAERIEQDPKLSMAKAELLEQARRNETGESTEYELYKYLKGRYTLIDQFIMLAKVRAKINYE